MIPPEMSFTILHGMPYLAIASIPSMSSKITRFPPYMAVLFSHKTNLPKLSPHITYVLPGICPDLCK